MSLRELIIVRTKICTNVNSKITSVASYLDRKLFRHGLGGSDRSIAERISFSWSLILCTRQLRPKDFSERHIFVTNLWPILQQESMFDHASNFTMIFEDTKSFLYIIIK